MWAELRTIATYPFVDIQNYLVLSVVVGIIGFVPMIGSLLSQCLLVAYGFQALSSVASGDLSGYRPSLGNIEDLADPLILALCALFISQGPSMVLSLYISPVSMLQALLNGANPLIAALVAFTILWGVLYMPIALVVASESRSSLDTLNPLQGIRLVGRMGGAYWQALTIFIAISIAQQIALFPFQRIHIPVIGNFAVAFISAYAYLCIGCALGFTVFKKIPELA
ncbi:MAG TPA: hypothetical protein VNV60_01415 [Holophagaceae bacterium]|jgi:hypothetical protein|nr:hypothetical protein [Holophagaceae bacterium]